MANEGYKLIVLNLDLRGTEFPISGPITNIGRSSENQIVLDQASVSRVHARIERTGDVFKVVDLGSRNGIKVDGRAVGEAELKPGAILRVGDVEMIFVPPTPSVERPAAPPGVPAPASGVPPSPPPGPGAIQAGVAAQPPTAPAQQVVTSPPSAEPAPKALGNLTGALVGLLAIVGVVAMATVYIRQRPKFKVLNLPPILIKVGETRWVRVQRPERVGNQIVYFPVKFRAETIAVEDPTVASAARFGTEEDAELQVTGLAGGNTDVTVRTLYDNIVCLRVMVRGRVEDPMEELDREYLTPEQRIFRGRHHIRNGEKLADTKMYAALKEFQRAVRVLKPIAAETELYNIAYTKEKEQAKRLQARYDELVRTARVAGATGDIEKQVRAMQDILELIPDEMDPRHQRTKFYLSSLILRVSEER